jgi:molecular chaperone DnaJ
MDFYVILGLKRGASQGEVKRAYKRVARRYHPDINPGDREAAAFYRRATEAYETLIDPDRRQEYDAHGVAVPMDEPATVEFQGFDFSASGTGGVVSATFRELFAEVLEPAGPARVPAGAERGSDVHGEIALGFHESLAGTERHLAITRLEVCEGCGGTGRRRALAGRCATCHGNGTTRWRRGHMIFSKSCAACGGSGRMRYHPCAACSAEGTVARDTSIKIQVPAGVSDGACLRVEAQGNAGRRGGVRGDLYITARVEGHRFLRREGDDLFVDLPVAVHEAALGALVDVPTAESPASLRIPPATQSGDRFRLPGRGAPSPRTGQRGDLVVTVTVVLPPAHDERSRRLLRELGRMQGKDVRKDLFED